MIAVATVCGLETAFADSDGYYCVGPDYLAYQLNSPGMPNTHRIIVVPFDGGSTKIVQYSADLPDFQVHDLRCSDKHIRLIGWEFVYDVTWDGYDPNPLAVSTVQKEPGPPDYGDHDPPQSLVYSPDQAVSLYDPDNLVSYGLETTRKDIPELPCTELVTTKLWKHKYDVNIDSLILVSRDVPRECGE